MFRFHDVPFTFTTTAGIHAGSEKAAFHSIAGAWNPYQFLFPDISLIPYVSLKGGTTRLSRALFIDTNCGMPLVSCKALLDVYLSMTSGGISSKPMVAGLPSHHKRMAAEFIASPASISAAKRRGYQFFANRMTLNALIADLWIKPWDGKGPDFLMSGPKGSSFLEVKGSTRNVSLSFDKFCIDKAQSVNAELRPFGGLVPTRHVLSKVYAPVGGPLSVHWFNQDQREVSDIDPKLEAVVLIAAGLSQFINQITNAGYDACALLVGMFVIPNEARRGHGFVLGNR